MNHKITEHKKLLRPDGSLSESGWANSLVLDYDPADVKANPLRIKEWDYYIVLSDEGYGLATVIADNRYMGLATCTFFDYRKKEQRDFLKPLLFPKGSLHMPRDSSAGDVVYQDASCSLSYRLENGGRHLQGKYKKSLLHGEIEFDIFLEQPPMDTMVIATPWKEDKTAFYYNQKINCMPASGSCRLDGRIYYFDPAKDFGTLDWGRGVWTYDNTWYWGSGNGLIEGKRFGYNIGYGFGDTSAASENMLFYGGKCHKLEKVLFKIPEDIMQPWQFVSTDKRFEMDFVPVYDNRTHINIGIFSQNAHQVFGKLSGVAVLDDGTALQVKDMLVFAEKVRNRY